MVSKMDPPALSLAKRIVIELQKGDLLDVSRVDRFVDLLASGKLREGDWKLAIENVSKPMKKPTEKKGTSHAET